MKAPDKIEPRWAWHNQALLALREKLLQARDTLRSDAATRTESGGTDAIDRANVEVGREVALAELDVEEAELTAVDAALQRLRNGTYGICTLCEQPIAAARLRAVPWTPYCHKSARLVERDTATAKSLSRQD
jgi:RNA polymerase-binding transcription factor DksA